jgi:hypothetical protein
VGWVISLPLPMAVAEQRAESEQMKTEESEAESESEVASPPRDESSSAHSDDDDDHRSSSSDDADDSSSAADGDSDAQDSHKSSGDSSDSSGASEGSNGDKSEASGSSDSPADNQAMARTKQTARKAIAVDSSDSSKGEEGEGSDDSDGDNKAISVDSQSDASGSDNESDSSQPRATENRSSAENSDETTLTDSSSLSASSEDDAPPANKPSPWLVREFSLAGIKAKLMWKKLTVILCMIVIWAILAVIFTEGICGAMEPNTVNTRLSRWANGLNNRYCIEEKSGPCHVYITLPEGETKNSVIVNFQVAGPDSAGEDGEDWEAWVYYDTTRPPTNKLLSYANKTKGKIWRQKSLDIDRFVCWVQLTGLDPKSTYYFRAGVDKGSLNEDDFSVTHHFSPVPGDATVKIAAGGDVGRYDESRTVRVNSPFPPPFPYSPRITHTLCVQLS